MLFQCLKIVFVSEFFVFMLTLFYCWEDYTIGAASYFDTNVLLPLILLLWQIFAYCLGLLLHFCFSCNFCHF